MEAKLKRLETQQRWERLTRLLEPFHRKALGTARRLGYTNDGGDGIYQDAVIRAFYKLHTLRDESCFKSWFFSVLVTVHRTRLRKSFWNRNTPLTIQGENSVLLADERKTPEDEVLGERRMRGALASLKPKQREAVVLFEVEGFSIEEVAKIQRSSIPAVKSRLVRGRSNLRGHYEKMGWSPGSAYSEPVTAPGLPQGGNV